MIRFKWKFKSIETDLFEYKRLKYSTVVNKIVFSEFTINCVTKNKLIYAMIWGIIRGTPLSILAQIHRAWIRRELFNGCEISWSTNRSAKPQFRHVYRVVTLQLSLTLFRIKAKWKRQFHFFISSTKQILNAILAALHCRIIHFECGSVRCVLP